MFYRRDPIGVVKRSKRVPAIAALFFVLYSLPSYGQQIVDVIVQNYRFHPQEIHIQPGDTVRWLNHEKRTSHSIVLSQDNGGESERFFPDESWQHRFAHIGIFPYHCGPHPEMTGTVIVSASNASTNCKDPVSHTERKIFIGSDRASIDIIQGNAPPKRFAVRSKLLPDVHYLSNGSYVLLATQDGWILKLDLETGRTIAEEKLNASVSATALSAPLSAQKQLLAVGSTNPPTLTILDEQLRVLKTHAVIDKTGRLKTNLLSIRTAKARNSFVGLLANAPELWEISYNPQAPEIGLGMVHDFQYREGHFVPGYLNPQRSTLVAIAKDFVLLDSGHEVLTVHDLANGVRDGGNVQLHVMHLDVRKTPPDSGVRFLPDLSELPWYQIDTRTLPGNMSNRAIKVIKSTLRFSNDLPAPPTPASHSKNVHPDCIQPQ